MADLTERQLLAVESAKKRWLGWISSTQAANREETEAGVRQTYRAAGRPEPEIFVWCDDLMEALLVVEQLSEHRRQNWMLPEQSLARREQAQRRVLEMLGRHSDWEELVEAAGPWQNPNRYERKLRKGATFMVAEPRKDCLQAGLRCSPDDPPCEYEAIEKAGEEVQRAGGPAYSEMEHMVIRAAGPGIPGHFGIASVPNIYYHYRWDLLFRHDCLLGICGKQSSLAYDGLRHTAQHGGRWWAFANAAVFCDRPREVHRDAEGRLHNEKSAALVFRSGLQLYAWHGSWVPEEAIVRPDALQRAAVSAEGDPKVRAALIEIYGAERYERERRKTPRRPPNPLTMVLPPDPEKKIEALRVCGPMPYYERYAAGEHRQVWRELCALGSAIRERRYLADALAVAYATMIRVQRNIEALQRKIPGDSEPEQKVVRLGEARWKLWSGQAPEWGRADLYRLDQGAGELPLSLRVFYEVVRPANLPGGFAVTPFSKILRAWDDSAPEIGEEGHPFVAEITAQYRITLPSPGMDAVLEPDGPLFVDHLRSALQSGPLDF